MMSPTEILSNEHRVIEQVLSALENIAVEAMATGKLEAEAAHDAVDFIRNFADRCHHGKEEVHLFKTLEGRGFSPDSGPTAVMRHEHDLGRNYVGKMDEAIVAGSQGDAKAVKQFTDSALAFVGLLRQHIHKEDNILFRMADQMLSDEDQKELLRVFEKIENKEMGEGTHERYLALAQKLAERYTPGFSRSTYEEHSCGCCCGHE